MQNQRMLKRSRRAVVSKRVMGTQLIYGSIPHEVNRRSRLGKCREGCQLSSLAS